MFQPGQSGNPGGRPKGEKRIREAAQEHSEAALQVMVDALTDDDARVRMKAAEMILDRAHGKPAQSIGGADDLPAIRLDAIVRRIVDARNTDTPSL